MAYLSERQVQARADRATRGTHRTARRVLLEKAATADQAFDVFLSHSSAEPERILLGIFSMLEDLGLSVYVDKYTDPHLSPDRITNETAEVLRDRMRSSNTLLYVYSRHSKRSRWMPWELGFFDGLKSKVGVIPVTREQEETFKGEEYLNLYPYVDFAQIASSQEQALWINRDHNIYAHLERWARGQEQIRRRG